MEQSLSAILIVLDSLHIPPVQVDLWKNHIVYFSVLYFESLYLIELAKILQITGQLFGDVGEAFEPGKMGHKSPDSVIFCLTPADNKWPIAGLQ